jgi:hypothetical protein
VSGSTLPNARVIISTELDDYTTSADDSGLFLVDTQAVAGTNEVLVTSVNPETSESVNKKIVYVYSSQYDLPTSDNTDNETNEATASSADDIRNNVQERLEEALTSPIAYLGSVTDISEETLQVSRVDLTESNNNGEIVQISVTDNTEYVDTTGDDSELIEFTDVAIGDFIIAMGPTNTEGVLEASRILVTDTISPTERVIIVGIISQVDDVDESIILDSGETIYTNRNTYIFSTISGEEDEIDLSVLERDNLIFAVNSTEDGETTTRTLYLFPLTNSEDSLLVE